MKTLEREKAIANLTLAEAQEWNRTEDKLVFVAVFLGFFSVDNPELPFWEDAFETKALHLLHLESVGAL